MINDNRQLDSWPLVTITSEKRVEVCFDAEPEAQRLELSCGHFVVNTYGRDYARFEVGGTLRCRQCAESVIR